MGTWGLIAGGMMQYAKEIFLGMIAPLIIGVISIVYLSIVHKNSPEKVTSVIVKSFAGKMVFYAVYFVYIFAREGDIAIETNNNELPRLY